MTAPGLSRLYSDYLHDFERVRRFYPAGLPAAYTGAFGEYPASRRRMMAAVLRRQNADWGLSATGEERLREFAQPDCAAVVTGQQVGLFGGPLLTVYKAMTAVLLAEHWRRQGWPAVPIFWMASQDHDVAEVDHAWALDESAQMVRLQVNDGWASGAAAGDLRLGRSATAALEELERTCGAPLETLRAAYREGASLADAFARVLARWFAPWGLLIYDPMRAPEAAAIWKPYYLAALEQQAGLADALGARAAELSAAGYHAQVEQTKAASMLFLHRDGRRQGLRHQGAAWLAGEERIEIGEARRFIEEHPEAVSAAALLRPLLQDVAFPTAAQVTGPAETAYLAQSAVLYAALEVSGPRPYPRASVTLLEPKARRLLQKYSLALEDVWREPASELLARQALPVELEAALTHARGRFEEDFAHIQQGLAALDSTLLDAAQGAGEKIRHQWEQLQARAGRSLARRSTEVSQQAQYLDNCLYPMRQLQERILSSGYWMARYPDLPARLHEQVNLHTTAHKAVGL
jgi:bacillithiol biosynthesis cysteine-adding enzyme BshC